MTETVNVIVAHEKHGTFTYSSPFVLLKRRFDEGYWYDNWDEGDPTTQWKDRAREIVEMPDGHDRDKAAWAFLRERSDHEYEWVQMQEVRS
jgi:hypothetical protein